MIQFIIKFFSLKGIVINERNQLELINEFKLKYSHEFIPYKNKGLSLLDSFILYSLIRSNKPKKNCRDRIWRNFKDYCKSFRKKYK